MLNFLSGKIHHCYHEVSVLQVGLCCSTLYESWKQDFAHMSKLNCTRCFSIHGICLLVCCAESQVTDKNQGCISMIREVIFGVQALGPSERKGTV